MQSHLLCHRNEQVKYIICMCCLIWTVNLFLIILFQYGSSAKPYQSANHYWPFTKIEKRKTVKDECGKTNAKVSDGVTTKNDAQLATVVSFNKNSDSMVMTPIEARCISDPSNCQQGITIEFWLKFRSGELN